MHEGTFSVNVLSIRRVTSVDSACALCAFNSDQPHVLFKIFISLYCDYVVNAQNANKYSDANVWCLGISVLSVFTSDLYSIISTMFNP